MKLRRTATSTRSSGNVADLPQLDDLAAEPTRAAVSLGKRRQKRNKQRRTRDVYRVVLRPASDEARTGSVPTEAHAQSSGSSVRGTRDQEFPTDNLDVPARRWRGETEAIESWLRFLAEKIADEIINEMRESG